MTAGTQGSGRKPLGRTLYDITQLLESVDGAKERVRRVLGLLRNIVPYDECAMLEAGRGHDARVVVVPEPAPDERAVLTRTLRSLFTQLADANAPASGPSASPQGLHLAVPLIGTDEIIGMLFVRSWEGRYTEDHLRALSIVAGNLAAYLTFRRARTALSQLARERDDAWRAAEAANRSKDDLLALVSHELKKPLSSIIASARVLHSTTGDVAAKDRAIGELERSVGVQVKLIDDILRLACVASAGVRLDLAKDPPDKQLAGISVLLVEDDYDLRESFRLVLGDYGAEVTTAASAPEALAALDQCQPDVLLLCDLATRGEAIYDLMRVVTARSRPVPIASISAWRLDEEARELKAGVRLRLAKPIEVRALVHAVANLAGRTQAKTSP